MKLNRLYAVLAAAGLFAAVGAAQASVTISFNPNGTGAFGAIGGITTFDPSPGNTLALNATNGGNTLTPGQTITDYFQANLGTMVDLDSNILFSNGTGGKFFTFVATFTEQVTSSVIDGTGVKNTFNITGGTFKMCAQAAAGNNLAGTGFACAGDGILRGVITGGNASQTGFAQQLQDLDQAGGNDWVGTQTVTSSGAANLNARIEAIDSGYFPDLQLATQLVLATLNSSLITPYGQTNPSRLFSSDTVANGDVAANVGAVNGITGPNFIFQSDANGSFSVPEPGSLALVGLALAGASLIRRRKA